MNMTYLEAIEKRMSRRSYLGIPVADDQAQVLMNSIQRYNQESGLSIQFIQDGGKAFQRLRKSYGLFSGVKSLIALVGNTSDPNLHEKAGYYGELLVLEATTLGLGTCFVGASYDKSNCPCIVKEDETLVCVITVGPVETSQGWKEKMIYRMVHRGKVRPEDICEADQALPQWLKQGIRAVQLAPSAVNRHPVKLRYQEGKVLAYVENTDGYNLMDLGIAKANFEIAAGGRFEWGNPGVFIKTEQ